MVKYWLAKLKRFDDKVVISHEHQNYKWFKLEDAKKIAPRHQHVLQNFYDYLNGKVLYHYKYGKIYKRSEGPTEITGKIHKSSESPKEMTIDKRSSEKCFCL